MRKVLLSVLFALCVVGNAHMATPGMFVTDNASLLSKDVVQTLEAKLDDIPIRNGVTLHVVTVEDFDGISAREYSDGLESMFAVEHPESKGAVLLLISKSQRQARIQATGTLYLVFSDVVSSRILEKNLSSSFGRGDIDGGVTRTVESMLGVIVDRSGGEYSSEFSAVSGLFSFGSLVAFLIILTLSGLLFFTWEKMSLVRCLMIVGVVTGLFTLTGVFGSLLGGVVVGLVAVPFIYGIKNLVHSW